MQLFSSGLVGTCPRIPVVLFVPVAAALNGRRIRRVGVDPVSLHRSRREREDVLAQHIGVIPGVGRRQTLGVRSSCAESARAVVDGMRRFSNNSDGCRAHDQRSNPQPELLELHGFPFGSYPLRG